MEYWNNLAPMALLLACLAVQPAQCAQGDESTPVVTQPSSLAESVGVPLPYVPEEVSSEEVSSEETLPLSMGLSLATVEELALANHPAIAQAQARLRALDGKWKQVGLAPNPTVGYLASEIGADGSAGQQGGFAGQQFITAKKLQRNRAIVCAEIAASEQELATIVQRVRTDVRLGYYQALLAQQRRRFSADLVRIADEATKTSQSLIEAEEIPLAGLLQTELQLENAKLLERTSRNGYDQAWRQLQTLVGSEVLVQQPLEGDVGQLPDLLSYEEQLLQVQIASPELASAMAQVERSRRVLHRECVEAVPNVSAQVSVQHDDSNGDTLTGVQISVPLPLWNRNQGGICRARAEVTQAARNVDRVEKNLQRRLVNAFREFSDARITAQTYADQILTRSERTLELVRQGYAQGEVGYLDFLTAQRIYSQTHLAYLDALSKLWNSYLRIEGLLLDGSFEANSPLSS